MHILSIDRDEGLLIQGAVRIELPKPEDGWMPRNCGHLRVALRAFASVPAVSRYVGVTVEPDGAVHLILAGICEPGDETSLRHVMAGFFRLDGLGDARVTSPGSAADFESAFMDHETDRWCIPSDVSMNEGTFPLMLPVRLFDLLPVALERATQLSVGFRYECTIASVRPEAELIRASRYAAVGLEMGGAPDILAIDQVGRIEALGHATAHVVEAVSGPTAFLEALENAAVNAVAKQPLATLGYAPTIETSSELDAEALGYLTHPYVLAHDIAPAPNGFVDETTQLARILCDPLARHMGVADPAATEAPWPVIPPAKASNAAPQSEPFFFLSYARDDWDQVHPIVGNMRARGVNIWTDAEIQATHEWDTTLEEKVRGSVAILCVVTDAFVRSKFCRREIKFADALDKPILAVLDETAELSGGLAMIFASCQYIPMQQASMTDQLYGAARALVGGHGRA